MARALACCYVTREALAASTQSHQQTTQHRVPKSLPGMKMLEPIEQGTLVYKPYLDYLCFQLLDSAPDVQALPLDDQLAFKSSPRKANVYNWLYSSRRLRRIRITYFDAGRACQALNALLYPDNSFDLPLLGIDLLSFGANKILCVVDFIPLFQDQGYLEKYIRPLALLRQPFAARCSEMSDRFFDKDKFASEQMIFFRSDQGSSEPDLESLYAICRNILEIFAFFGAK
ncbi:hypothetical protein SELMODRAFT_426447 [Selaginella moellendorffii]|uniref:Uncharacterized protein n=1 Tax=Selaginella moellendorffii TaxID=88036 RepID=D8SWD9_SELML|nr:hypothetical protein SELMODRAFT_426447 [Selaginella moellendorffii]